MAQGINTVGDIIQRTVNNVDTNTIWQELTDSLQVWNEHQSAFVSLFTFPVTEPGELVAQVTTRSDFEKASEFGVSKSFRGPDTVLMAYGRDDYDARTSFTSLMLRDSTAAQIESVHDLVLSADSQLTFSQVMRAVFNNANRTNPEGMTIRALWNADGMVPPSYLNNTFNGTHSHYLTSGAAGIDSGDVEALIDHIRHHGYAATFGDKLILLVNPQEAKAVRSWRAGQVNANAQTAAWDFIPSEGTPAYLSSAAIIGNAVPSNLQGLTIIGSYGPVLVSEDALIPAGYMVALATSGAGSPLNPIGFREHPSPGERGLKLIPGNTTYPLTGSYYTRCFGTGARHRGAAAVMQITASGAYAVPGIYV